MKLFISLVPFVFLVSCDRQETEVRPSQTNESQESSTQETPEEQPQRDARIPDEPQPTCEEVEASHRENLGNRLQRLTSCRWDTDCVLLPLEGECMTRCSTTVSSSAVVEARRVFSEANSTWCQTRDQRGCEHQRMNCRPSLAFCHQGSCRVRAGNSPRPEYQTPEIAPQNSPSLTNAPERPPVGDAEERARRLFQAIVGDDPLLAMDFFFPREVFLILKGIADPGRYYDRLLARYLEDIHNLHRNTPNLENAEFVRLDLVSRGGWVGVREEGNRLPYWASRHSRIIYHVGEEERQLEVRVLITWEDRWYVIHLSEFR